jgi:hypothetical protein
MKVCGIGASINGPSLLLLTDELVGADCFVHDLVLKSPRRDKVEQPTRVV